MAGKADMGTTKRKPRDKKPLRNSRSETTNETASVEADTGKDGFESLRIAAEKQLGQLSDEIAEALGKKAAEGDLNSTKLLIAVAARKEGKGKRRKRPGPSVAEQLALEPPWEEPAETDGNSDVGSGGAAH